MNPILPTHPHCHGELVIVTHPHTVAVVALIDASGWAVMEWEFSAEELARVLVEDGRVRLWIKTEIGGAPVPPVHLEVVG